MRQLNAEKNLVSTWKQLSTRINETKEMLKLAIQENDQSIEQDIEKEIETATGILNDLEIQLMFDDEYDDRDAILAIHAGAGGTESQDWAEMLLRMYTRWAERHDYKTEIIDSSPGEEAGIKSATLEIKGPFVYGHLKSEHGVHRLVRLSPFNSDHARHTSFALIEVLPEVKAEQEINISPEDIRVDTFRSSGPGGQHMQKTSSAVRITHIPSGIVVSCENERSQLHNKESALRVLHARLLEIERLKKEAEKAKLKGNRIDAGWGNQIRSYVLHPYKMVKDHRTEYETGNTTNVLDGEIDEFINAYLRTTVGDNNNV